MTALTMSCLNSSTSSTAVSSLTLDSTEGVSFAVLRSCQGLPAAFHDIRVHLHRTSDGMRRLLARCAEVGVALETCTDALATAPLPADAAPHSVARCSAGSEAATGEGGALGRLHWSLGQFHSRLAQLLAPASVQAYNDAVATKVVHRLGLMDRGTQTFQRAVAELQRSADGNQAAVLMGVAQQLEQLVVTRFAPAYSDFLRFAVASLGDFYALWQTAVLKSAEEVTWASQSEGTSPKLEATEHVPASPGKKARDGASSKAKAASHQHGRLHSERAADDTTRRARSDRSSPAKANATAAHFAAAIAAVQDLREVIFEYVRLLHGTVHSFRAAAALLSRVLTSALGEGGVPASVAAAILQMEAVDEELVNSHTRMTTRRCCYEAILDDRVLRLLRMLQDNASAVRVRDLFVPDKYPQLLSRTSSSLDRTLSRLRLPAWDLHRRLRSLQPSRSTSRLLHSRQASDAECGPLEVLFDAWYSMAELFMDVGSEASTAFVRPLQM